MNVPARDIGQTLPYLALNSLEVLELGGGNAQCATVVGAWLEGTPEIGVPAGVAALADMVLMYASSTRPSPGHFPVTVSLRIDLWSTPPPCGSRLEGRARVEPTQGDALLVRGEILDGDSIVATASSRSMLVPIGGGGQLPKRVQPASGPSVGIPGFEAILGLPSSRLAGLEIASLHDGAVELNAKPTSDLERTNGVLHGGALPMLGSLASSVLMQSLLPDHTVPRRLDLTTDFLRPTLIDTKLRLRSQIVNRSRRVIQTHTEVFASNGRPTAIILETFLVEPSEAVVS